MTRGRRILTTALTTLAILATPVPSLMPKDMGSLETNVGQNVPATPTRVRLPQPSDVVPIVPLNMRQFYGCKGARILRPTQLSDRGYDVRTSHVVEEALSYHQAK